MRQKWSALQGARQTATSCAYSHVVCNAHGSAHRKRVGAMQQNVCTLTRRDLYRQATGRLHMSDRIEKTIELKAPVSRVWKALTDHEEFGTWFRVRLDGPFVPGPGSRVQRHEPD